MLTLIISTLISALIVEVFRFLNKKRKPAIFGIYQQKNKLFWPKFIFMYTILRVRQFLKYLKREHAVEVGKSGDGNIRVHEEDKKLEQKYCLGSNPLAIDAVYFNGMSREGDAVICGVARRPQNICDAFLYLKLNSEELLLSPNLPDTCLKQTESEGGEYKVNGIEVHNFIPMRTWKLTYNGSMKLHQTHYEQMGVITGIVKVDGKQYELNMPAVRDHSFGPFRDWRTFHRYVYHFIFLDNGDCMAIGSVSQPAILSHLTIGYYCRKSDQAVFPVEWCDFQLYQHGEMQTLPKDYGFMFKAGGDIYTVKVQVDDEDVFYIGKERTSKFYERWSTVDINGVKGRACVEWQYNNVLNVTNKL
uniref:DUF7065 domain-containing protein n=1 Tax=Bombyx mori TaxID=7091 RepID=A0A8R2R1L6_BOMMO|nr:uncharacterized protein LOC101746561 isoform X2 [Bombyx mori]